MTVADTSSETPEVVSTEGDGQGLPTTSNTDATAASSTAPETVASTEPKGEDSGGEDAKRPASVLEAAKAALTKDKGADPSSADVKPGQPKAESAKVGEQPAKTESKPESGDAPQEFHKHPAWQRIIKDRDEYKSGAERWNRFEELVNASGFGDVKGAEAWMNAGARLNQVGVNPQEQNVLVEFAAATKTDPARALAIMSPVIEALRGIVGEGELPADLREQVDRGEISEDAARRIVKAEAAQRIDARRTEKMQKDAERDRATQAEIEAGKAMVSEVAGWERRISAAEPDWQRIAPLVNEQVILLRDARKPRTPAEAVKCCDDALAMVKKMGGTFVQPKPEVIPPRTPSSNRRQETRATSVFEHVKRSLVA